METNARIWLRTRRVEREQTQDEAAAAVGVSKHTWFRWEAMELQPRIDQAARIAKWADCSVDDVATAFGVLAD